MENDKTDVPKPSVYRMMHPRLTIMVTSVDKEGTPNIITLAWSMITSFKPLMLAISVSPDRYSHGLIKESGEFTVNIPTMDILKETLLCGRVSGREYDKFKITGLIPEPAENVKPPLIKECIAHLECRVKDTMKTGDHTIFAGEILRAIASRKSFNEKYDIGTTNLIYHLGKNDFTTNQKDVITPNWRDLLPK
ncbi:MAG: flavin reductase family protein [Candidatus Hydrothermarchaeales archaeon]